MTPFIKLSSSFLAGILLLSAMTSNIALCDELDQARGYFDYYDQDPSAHRLLGLVEQYHLNQGITGMNKGSLNYARGDFEFILNRFPNHPRVLLLIGDLFIKMKAPTRAEPYFQRAIELYPNTAPTYAAYGIFLQKTGQLGRAIDSYKTSLELDPGSPSVHYNLGLAYFEKKQFDLANMHAQEAYMQGFQLPGLRDKLRKAGAWKPLEQSTAASETAQREADLHMK
ncbi:MAG: tetratricopeptide repeat protein [Betaproteobacteria bacterium]